MIHFIGTKHTMYMSGMCHAAVLSSAVVSDPLWPYRLWPTRILCPWNFIGKNTGVGCHFLLQGIFLTEGSNLHFLCLLHCRQILYPLSHQGSPQMSRTQSKSFHIENHENLSLREKMALNGHQHWDDRYWNYLVRILKQLLQKCFSFKVIMNAWNEWKIESHIK